MTIIVGGNPTGKVLIGYKNLFTEVGATVAASTEATDFEKENAYDGFGYDFWKPTATGDSTLTVTLTKGVRAADYAAVWAHNLSDHGSSVKIQYSTTDGSSWIDVVSATNPNKPNDNRTLFFKFDSILASRWRLVVTNPTTIASIGGVQIGEALQLTKDAGIGFAPPSLAPSIDLKTARSEKGAFLSASKLSEGIRGNISMKNLDPDWVRSEWQPFIKHVQTPATFVLAWDPIGFTNEVVNAWARSPVPNPFYSSALYMDASLNFEGTP